MSIWNNFIKPILVLGCICLAASGALALTNSATAPVIAANEIRTANEARAAVLPAATSFTQVETTAEGVLEMYEADNGAGWVITAASKGYAGDVPVMVAFGTDGNIVGVSFLDNDETPGLGQKVTDPAFAEQFAGLPSESLSLSGIDAVAGATISSSASISAINYAIDCYNQEVKGEEVVVLTDDEIRASILPDAGTLTLQTEAVEGVDEWYRGEVYGKILYVQVLGFYQKPLIAAVGIDDDGVVTGVWFNTENETEGFGQEVGKDAAFAAQFIGKTDTSNYDVVAGATTSSNAAAAAVEAALQANKLIG